MSVPVQNFQPQTRDTTNGPHVHTYIPRSDGSIVIGGIVYVQQAPVVSVPIVPVNVAAPVVAAPPVQSHQPSQSSAPKSESSTQGFLGCLKSCFATLTYLPQVQRPVYYQQPAMMAPQYPVQSIPMVNGVPTFNIAQPAYGMQPQYGMHSYGQTGSELLANQIAIAANQECNAKQEMKPADDDPFRMYWVRELDGTYLLRNRVTIDSGDIGDVRWFALDGKFYAVRLPRG